MSMVGFYIGNESGTVAMVRGSSIDIVLNDESKQQTPTVVCFGDEQQVIGSGEAAASSIMTPNSISQINRSIGILCCRVISSRYLYCY
ncbi:putative Heat shock protein 70 family [Rosa chinensis]|uniref:Putative Heat shock protein 70 family n=1 Tax=Rosa chinensis TaxID=74649 RepID=A0A2P6PA17_ROSCH|nr:putative Heat shock protein 70 family [Rosa chinensis]